jgi:Leucine-rich repeat (LRR) protein
VKFIRYSGRAIEFRESSENMENASLPTAEQNTKPKRKLRWYQYSLRSLLIVVTLFAFACSWFTVQMQKARRQQEAVRILSKYDYVIGYDSETPRYARNSLGKNIFYNVVVVGDVHEYEKLRCGNGHPRGIPESELALFQNLPQLRTLNLNHFDIYSTQSIDKGITYIENLKMLEILDLSGSDITDAGLAHLEGLKRLRELKIARTKITDAGLEILKDWTWLHKLDLTSNSITDVGLNHIKGMSQLQELSLHNTPITDAGMENLKELLNLEVLYINYTQITDKGLKSLAGLAKLKHLECSSTSITDAGVKDLQNALPSLKIVH